MLTSLLILEIAFSIIKNSGANVSIQEYTIDETPLECGKSLTLSCTFDKDSIVIAWKTADEITHIAQCIFKECTLNPKYDGVYKITFDIEQNVFNLTILLVNMTYNGMRLVCSDGSNKDYYMIKVKEYEPLLLEDSENRTIKAISGCASHDTEISFKWFKIKDCKNMEEEISLKIKDNKTETCSDSFECRNGNRSQYKEVVRAKRDEKGYCLKIVAVYGEERNESYQTEIRFTVIEEQVADERLLDSTIITLPVAIAMIALAFIIMCIGECFFRKTLITKKCWCMSQKEAEEWTQPRKQKDESINDETDYLIFKNEPKETFMNNKQV